MVTGARICLTGLWHVLVCCIPSLFFSFEEEVSLLSTDTTKNRFNDIIRPPLKRCVRSRWEPLLPEEPIDHI